MRRGRTLVPILAAALLAPAADAAAATAEVGCTGSRGCTFYYVAFRAAPGEANRVTVTREGDRRIRIRDTAAPIVPGDQCERVDDHEVACSVAYAIRAWLGDGDDRFLSLVDPTGDFVHGGTGNDRIDAGGILNGGGGRDVLRGSGSSDTLIDGDSVRSPDADVMDGSGGVDTVSYEGRRAPVNVDLVHYGQGGERGERDRVLNVEGVIGGAGDDLLVARRPEGRGMRPILRGEKGDDVLVGSAAADHIVAGPGADVVRSRGGSDLIDLIDHPGRPSPDVIDCGDGPDVPESPEIFDFLAASCERVDGFGPFLSGWLHVVGRGSRPVFGVTGDCFVRGGCLHDVRVVARPSRLPGAPPAGAVLAHRRVVARGERVRIALRLTPAARRALRTARRLPVAVETRWQPSSRRLFDGFRTELVLDD